MLDYFEEESIDYKRTNVQVQIPDDNSLDEDIQALVTKSIKDDGNLRNRILNTQAYIWLKGTETLDVTRDWDFDDFQQNRLDWYLQYTVKPCRDEAEKTIL